MIFFHLAVFSSGDFADFCVFFSPRPTVSSVSKMLLQHLRFSVSHFVCLINTFLLDISTRSTKNLSFGHQGLSLNNLAAGRVSILKASASEDVVCS